ncbi:MAG TPA: signal peptidase II [bacterium]|nr:signal peptidase II [bacterium]
MKITRIQKVKYFWLLLIALLFTSCDLSTKWLAQNRLKHTTPVTIVSGFVELNYTENTAIAFSMLGSIESGIRKWIIYGLSLIALTFLGVIAWKMRHESLCWLVALTLILSGALGNIIERIFRGYVIDFIHLHYHYKFSWPVFNLADILITSGAVLLGILTLRKTEDITDTNPTST